MFFQPSFGPLSTRSDLAAAMDRLLDPLTSHFTPDGTGISLGVAYGGNGKKTAEFEAFARPLLGLVPLLAGGNAFKNTVLWSSGLIAGTDPAHPGYWGLPGDFDQKLVEQPSIALAITLAPDHFWNPLSDIQRGRVVDWLAHANSVKTVDSNWIWFRVIVNACLRKLGEKWSPEQLEIDLSRIEQFHLGGGWYRDENRRGDYYIPMAMQLYSLLYASLSEDFDATRVQIFHERATTFARDFQHWFATDGSAIPFGRSLIYRMAQGSFWGALAFANVEALPWGEIKGLLLRHLRWWLAQPIFSESGLLTVGYRYLNPAMGEGYNSAGSPYWAFKAFWPLALPEDHPFWQAEELPLPEMAAVSIQPNAAMTLCRDDASDHVFALNWGQPLQDWPRHCAHKYGKCCYSSTFGFGISSGGNARQAGLDATFAVSDDGGQTFRLREKCADATCVGETASSVWQPWPDVEIRTWLVPVLPGHLRVHRIRSAKKLLSTDGGFAIDQHGVGYRVLPCETDGAAVANDDMGAAMLDLSGGRRCEVISQEPWSHLMWSATAFPVLQGNHEPGETWLISYASGCAGSWSAEAVQKTGWAVSITPERVSVMRHDHEYFLWES